jgi:DNA-binding SARP family transcriptional activator
LRAATTNIALCGPLVVEIDGHRVEGDLPGRQGRLLFAYLAAHRRRPVSRAELIEVLWPSDPPASPEAALKVLLARLRRVIGAALAGRADISLDLPDDAVIDVEVVDRAVADAEAALERGDPRAALVAVTSALEIAERPLLPEFDGAWVNERRRELQEHATTLLEAEAGAALRIGDDELAQGERAARELTRREPFRESGYARLMEIHEARGNVAEAVRVFDELRVLLRDELGTAPSAPIVALNERQRERPAHPRDGPAGRGPALLRPARAGGGAQRGGAGKRPAPARPHRHRRGADRAPRRAPTHRAPRGAPARQRRGPRPRGAHRPRRARRPGPALAHLRPLRARRRRRRDRGARQALGAGR